MAKIKGPLFSFGARGQLGKALVFSSWHGIKDVRSHVVPANPNTVAQGAQRGVVADTMALWGTTHLNNVDRAAFNLAGNTAFKRITGYNSFVQQGVNISLAGRVPLPIHDFSVVSPVPPGIFWFNLGQQFGEAVILSLCSLGGGIVLAGTALGGKILRSVDYGVTWVNLGQQFGEGRIYCLCPLGGGIVLAGTGQHGKILRSSDCGVTWSNISYPDSFSFVASLISLGGGVVLGGDGATGKILHSSDYGLSWTVTDLFPTEPQLTSLCFLGSGVVLAGVSTNDQLYRSTDSGFSWTQKHLPVSTLPVYSLLSLGGGSVLVGTGHDCNIFKSTDYGQNFIGTGTPSLPSTDVKSLVDLGGGSVLAGVAGGILLRSGDFGLNWTSLGQQFGESAIFSLCGVGGGTFLAGTYPNGMILRSPGGLSFVRFLLSVVSHDVDFFYGLSPRSLSVKFQCSYSLLFQCFLCDITTLLPGRDYFGRFVSRSGDNSIISGLYKFHL